MDRTTLDELKRMMREQFGADVDRIQIQMHKPVHSQRLVFAVASFDWPEGAEIVPGVQSPYDKLIAPLVRDRSDVTLQAAYRKAGSSHARFFQPDVVNWKKFVEEYPADILLLHVCPSLTDTFKSPEVAALSAIVGNDLKGAHTVQAHISIDDLLGSQVNASYQALMVNQVKHLYQLIHGVNGFITIHDRMSATSVGLDTPLERSVGLTYYRSSPAFRERLRGYFWGNFLSRRHVEILGGERVIHTAPVEVVEELGNGSYYLQVSNNINDISEEQLGELRRFLYPVLPKG